MSFELRKLEDVCDILDHMRIPITSRDRKAGPYPYYGANGIQDYIDDYIFDDELVLLAEDGGNFGSKEKPIAYRISGKTWVNNHAHVLKPKNIIDVDYLCYSLMYYDVSGLVNGATRQKLTQSEMRKINIRYRRLEKQRQIVFKIKLISNIISSRKHQLCNLDSLVKSRFIEMFGDVEESSKRWNTVYLEKVIQSIESGWSGNGIQRNKLEGEIAVLKVSAVTKGFFIPSECKVLEDQKNIKKYIYPHKDDLLFSRANTKEMVGATVIISKDFPELILPDKLWRIRFNELANIYFIKYVLSSRSIRNKLSSEATGTSGSMYNISMQKLKQLAIPLPPTDLQNNFAAFVSKIDKSKFVVTAKFQ